MDWKVEQFFDEGLAHLSYAILSEGKIALVDPERDISQYLEFAENNNAEIVAVFETHPHADFVSSHAEFAKKDVKVYISKLAGVQYPFEAFDEGQEFQMGKVKIKALNTPGHSPDSISLLLEDPEGKPYALFTGDTLFIGDVGRPDLRESAGCITVEKEKLARELYCSLHDKILKLPGETIVYPAHGPGSLCGKSMSNKLSSSLEEQKQENYALQPMSEDEFVKILLENQPSIPGYFAYDVELNRIGAAPLKESLEKVKHLESSEEIKGGALVVDTRPQGDFKKGHLSNSYNIQDGLRFETWLGTIVAPNRQFYLLASDDKKLKDVLNKTAKIGYETNILGVYAQKELEEVKEDKFDLETFQRNPEDYTIVDIRSKAELRDKEYFENSIHIPLNELEDRVGEIPTGRPVVVHCAGGYRSAIGYSILSEKLQDQVFDLSDNIKEFEPVPV